MAVSPRVLWVVGLFLHFPLPVKVQGHFERFYVIIIAIVPENATREYSKQKHQWKVICDGR